MKHQLVVISLLLGATGSARATPAEELGTAMEAYANIEAYLGDGTSIQTLATERKDYGKSCDALAAKAKKALKADAEIIAWRLGGHPNAHKVGDKFAVKVSDLPWFCDRYRNRLDELELRFLLDQAKVDELVVKDGFTEDQKKDMRGGGQQERRHGPECTAVVAAMTKHGVGDTFVIKTSRNSAKLSEMPAVCDLFAKYADLRDAEWKVQAVKYEKPFKDAGLTGDRLDWFVYYGPGIEVWYLPGCKGETTLKQISKAPLLFQWLSGGDGITIRRFQWNGNKLVSQTEKEYATEAAAYAGCR